MARRSFYFIRTLIVNKYLTVSQFNHKPPLTFKEVKTLIKLNLN